MGQAVEQAFREALAGMPQPETVKQKINTNFVIEREIIVMPVSTTIKHKIKRKTIISHSYPISSHLFFFFFFSILSL